MALRSRLKTIVGNDASWLTAISRLLFYIRVSNPLYKIGRKFFGRNLVIQELKIPILLSPSQQLLWDTVRTNNPSEKTLIENYIQAQNIEATLLPINETIVFQFLPKGYPLVSIIIPTKNRSELVKVCIDSILKNSTYVNFEIILIDNRSDELALANVIQQYQQMSRISFTQIYADIDFNFSALMNLGATNAKGDYLLFLNNDTEIITPEWIEYLLGFAQQNDVGAVGCKLLYPNQTIQHAGIILDRVALSKHVHVGKERFDKSCGAIALFPAVTAACLMVSKAKFSALNGFDESFSVEFNDIDLCLRLHSKGYLNLYLPQVELFHYESASRRHPFSDSKNYDRHLLEKVAFKKKWSTFFGYQK